MDPIIETFLHDPFFFVIGLILAIALLAYKRIMLFFKSKTAMKPSGAESANYNLNLGVKLNDSLNPQISKETRMSVKEISEVILAVDAIVYDCVVSLKGPESAQIKLAKLFANILADKDLQSKVIAAFEGYQNIPAEVKELNAEEGLELAAVILPLIGKYFKK